MGTLYASIETIKFTMIRLESLGPDYELGRMMINEVEEYYVDSDIFK